MRVFDVVCSSHFPDHQENLNCDKAATGCAVCAIIVDMNKNVFQKTLLLNKGGVVPWTETKPWTHDINMKPTIWGKEGDRSSRHPRTTSPSWTRVVGEERSEAVKSHVLSIVTVAAEEEGEGACHHPSNSGETHEPIPWTQRDRLKKLRTCKFCKSVVSCPVARACHRWHRQSSQPARPAQ